tara:strand:+ start:257 stop:1360 length:1104 start_codon:yes stop_codon:yes gene_type:complete
MYQFTSESVSEGHPDKVADLISDRVADYILNNNIANRTAIETLVTTNMVTIAGEYKTDKGISNNHIERIITETVKEIGYEQEGFDWKKLKIYNELHGQSTDIGLGTDNFGAGDQGLMFGYACDETDNQMPLAINYCHKILEELSKRRKNQQEYKEVILPDSKSQITVNYGNDGEVVDIDTVLVSTQHNEQASQNDVKELVMDVVEKVIPQQLLTKNTKYLINPTGRFVIGGPDGDTGLTGRKIIVDTYGGAAPHGGGAFSGKDGSKVDRSGAYMSRWIAKNIVDFYGVKNCLVQLSYAIGVKDPTSILIKCENEVRHDLIDRIKNDVDLTPLGIIERFNLGTHTPLSSTTNYGHFGKDSLPWEQLNL